MFNKRSDHDKIESIIYLYIIYKMIVMTLIRMKIRVFRRNQIKFSFCDFLKNVNNKVFCVLILNFQFIHNLYIRYSWTTNLNRLKLLKL